MLSNTYRIPEEQKKRKIELILCFCMFARQLFDDFGAGNRILVDPMFLHVWELKNGCRNENMKSFLFVPWPYRWPSIAIGISIAVAVPIATAMAIARAMAPAPLA